jgi:hypothetical protein
MNIKIHKVVNGYRVIIDNDEYVFPESGGTKHIGTFIGELLAKHDFSKKLPEPVPYVPYVPYYYLTEPPVKYPFTIMYGVGF